MTNYDEDREGPNEDTDRAYEIWAARNDRDDSDDFVSPEYEERDAEMGASFGDARRCPRHPHVKTSSDDGMFDADCYVCEGEQEEAGRIYEQEQFEFAHPIEAAIQRVESMAYAARRERERKAAIEEDDICF